MARIVTMDDLVLPKLKCPIPAILVILAILAIRQLRVLESLVLQPRPVMSQPTPALIQERPNVAIFYGFIFILLTIASDVPVLYTLTFPGQEYLPWINLALPSIAVILVLIGLKRAIGQPDIYRGKGWGWILTVLSVLILAGSIWGYRHSTDIPASIGAPRVGEKAPDFTLSDTSGKPVSLSQSLTKPMDAASGKAPKAVLLVFYRGWW
jgi:hypothetical protein